MLVVVSVGETVVPAKGKDRDLGILFGLRVIVPAGGDFRNLAKDPPLLVAEASGALADGAGVVDVANIRAVEGLFREAFFFGKGPEGFGGGLVDSHFGNLLSAFLSIGRPFRHSCYNNKTIDQVVRGSGCCCA